MRKEVISDLSTLATFRGSMQQGGRRRGRILGNHQVLLLGFQWE